LIDTLMSGKHGMICVAGTAIAAVVVGAMWRAVNLSAVPAASIVASAACAACTRFGRGFLSILLDPYQGRLQVF